MNDWGWVVLVLDEFMLLLRKTPSVNELIDFMKNGGFENYINFTNASNNPYISNENVEKCINSGIFTFDEMNYSMNADNTHMCIENMIGRKNFHHIFFSVHIHDDDMAQRNCPPTHLVEILCKNPVLSCASVMHQWAW